MSRRLPLFHEPVNRDLASNVTVTVNHDKGSNAMSFGPQSQQIDFGSHAMIIDTDDRKVRVFSDLDTPEYQSSRDWRGVSEKLSELGVRELSEVPSDSGNAVICAEGAY